MRELILSYIGGQKHSDSAVIDLLNIYQKQATKLEKEYCSLYTKMAHKKKCPSNHYKLKKKNKSILPMAVDILRDYVIDELDKRLKENELFENVNWSKIIYPHILKHRKFL